VNSVGTTIRPELARAGIIIKEGVVFISDNFIVWTMIGKEPGSQNIDGS
jgi:hypothetical protein